jgi:hypothetical protein
MDRKARWQLGYDRSRMKAQAIHDMIADQAGSSRDETARWAEGLRRDAHAFSSPPATALATQRPQASVSPPPRTSPPITVDGPRRPPLQSPHRSDSLQRPNNEGPASVAAAWPQQTSMVADNNNNDPRRGTTGSRGSRTALDDHRTLQQELLEEKQRQADFEEQLSQATPLPRAHSKS